MVRAVIISTFTGLILSACSGPLETRPRVEGFGFGLVFEATLEHVLHASAPGGDVDALYGDSAASIARYAAESRNLNNINVTLIGDLFSAIATALSTDIERRLTSTRCVYVIKPDDDDILKRISNNILLDSQTDAIFDNVFSDPAFNNLDDDELEDLREDTQRQVQRKLQQNLGAIGHADTLALIQLCNPALLKGDKVILTYFESGGTIHPVKDTDLRKKNSSAHIDTNDDHTPEPEEPRSLIENSDLSNDYKGEQIETINEGFSNTDEEEFHVDNKNSNRNNEEEQLLEADSGDLSEGNIEKSSEAESNDGYPPEPEKHRSLIENGDLSNDYKDEQIETINEEFYNTDEEESFHVNNKNSNGNDKEKPPLEADSDDLSESNIEKSSEEGSKDVTEEKQLKVLNTDYKQTAKKRTRQKSTDARSNNIVSALPERDRNNTDTLSVNADVQRVIP